MSFYCLKRRKNAENINPRVSNTKNGKTMVLSKNPKCGARKSRFKKKTRIKGILSSLGLKTSLSKVS